MRKICKIIEKEFDLAERYLDLLEDRGYPVVKSTTLSLEEFNDELRAGILFAEKYEDRAEMYLNELENMGLLIVRKHILSTEEYNAELIHGIPVEETVSVEKPALVRTELSKVS